MKHTNWKLIILGPLILIVLSIIFFAIYPLVLETQPNVANATNVTEYLALEPIVNLSPLIIFIAGLAVIVTAAWAGLTGKAGAVWEDFKAKASGQRPWR